MKVIIPPFPRAFMRNKLIYLRLANQNPEISFLAKAYDNYLNAEKNINIIDIPIKILEDINDKERLLSYSLNPFQKPETDTARFDKSNISDGTLTFKY
jgi:hypothetical protein